MARASGRMVMHGRKDRQYSMFVDFADNRKPHQLRKGGYFLGCNTHEAMMKKMALSTGNEEKMEQLNKAALSTGTSTGNLEPNKPDMNVNKVTASTDELRTFESLSSTESPKRTTPLLNSPRTAVDYVGEVPVEEVPKEEFPEELVREEEVPERSPSVAGLPPQPLRVVQALPALGISKKKKPAKSLGRISNSLKKISSEEKPVKSVDRTTNSPRRSSSEEENEVKIKEVDDYTIFIEDRSRPVSLCILPLEFASQQLVANGKSLSTSEVFICGKSRGMDVMRPITAWKLTFPAHESFCILVKITKVKNWVKLGKPRSGYKETAQEFLSVARFLAFVKKDPHASEDRVRSHLVQGDLLSVNFFDHLRKQRSLMEQYIDLDPTLKEADARKILLSLTLEKESLTREKRVFVVNDDSSDEDNYPRAKKTKMDYTRPDDVSMREYESEEEYYEDEGLDDKEDDVPGDTLCSFCDDGGYLLLCDGPCLRSFHPRRQDGTNSDCKTLGFPDESDISKTKRGWFCTNCKSKKHQCYACGQLGNSDVALGPEREIFVCDVASCGKFYHPKCVVKQLMPTGTVEERRALIKGIRAGEESFTCPLHRCQKCGKGEEKKVKDLNLAICRRCPKAWHVECLPRTLSFDGNRESNFEVRAWELGKRFIIYCTDHKILADLGTPTRDHIKFMERSPEPTQVFKKPQKQVSTVGNERPGLKARASSSSVSQKLGRSAETAKPATQHTIGDAAKSLVDDIWATSRKKITEESVMNKIVLPKNYKWREINWMPQGRFDSILNGARAAMEKFNRGNDWDDARLKCAREQVVAISYEEERLRTFLAPTLHGKRYTSYGRHFTKIEKLQKVVEVLQPYIQDGDAIVDFSCGENTFSRLLSNALSSADKSNCQYKNFDIFTPKDTFGFVRQDWLSVGVNECGPGDNLVIGLNPPFSHSDQFISHALSMNPRVLVLIVPPLTKPLSDYGYSCLLDDHTTMAEKSFYLPGSVHGLNDEYLEQGNSTAPHLYIFGKNSHFGASNPSSTANLSQPIPPVRKSVKAAKPKLPSGATDHLFINRSNRSSPLIRIPVRDPRDVSVPPQHMGNRMSRASGSAPQMEEGEILPPPPPPPLLPPPPPPPPPPHRPSHFGARPRGHPRPFQFHGRPQHHPLPFDPRFYPYHSPQPPFHHTLDEYSPFAPELFPPGHQPRGFPRHHPRDFHRAAFRGMHPPAFGTHSPELQDLPEEYGGWLPPQ